MALYPGMSIRFFPFAPLGRMSFGRISTRCSKRTSNLPSPSQNLVDIGLERLIPSVQLPTNSTLKILYSVQSVDQVKESDHNSKEYSTSS